MLSNSMAISAVLDERLLVSKRPASNSNNVDDAETEVSDGVE